MCIGIPGRITALGPDDVATVDVGGTPRAINIGLLAGEPIAPGDWVVIHMGFALQTMSESEAREALEFLAAAEAGDIEANGPAR